MLLAAGNLSYFINERLGQKQKLLFLLTCSPRKFESMERERVQSNQMSLLLPSEQHGNQHLLGPALGDQTAQRLLLVVCMASYGLHTSAH